MTPSLERREQIARAFQETFRGLPTTWCRAPGRVDLMGSHTDYNLGYVLTLPIGLDIWVAARPRKDHAAHLRSLNLDAENSFSLDELVYDPNARWGNYVRGVAAALRAEGLALTGFDAVIHSTVPLGGGLSSSAALECATAVLFQALGGWKLDPVRMAFLCQRAENRFVGVNCGILDQFRSCLGQKGCALLSDCRDLSNRPVKLAEAIQVVVCDTKTKRELATSEYGRRRAQCEEGARALGVKALRELSVAEFRRHSPGLSPEVGRRCRFILEENERVLTLAEALPGGNHDRIGQLCAESFAGATSLYEIGAPAMETMMRAMLDAPGIIGARQAGAGFGGCLVAFVDKARVDGFTQAVRDSYCTATGKHPEVFPVEAAPDARCFLPSGALTL